MNKEEAKSILQAYSSDLNTEDAEEVLNEALDMANTDDELAQWLVDEQQIDAALSEKFSSVTPPEDLKAKLLALNPARNIQSTSAAEPSAAESGMTAIPFAPPKREIPWWKNPMTISMAASIIIVIGFLAILVQPQTALAKGDLPRFYEAVSSHVRQFPPLATKTSDFSQIRAYLATAQAPTPGELPQNLNPMPAIGCVSYQWEGRPVAVVCLDGEKIHHLYILSRNDFPNEEHPQQPAFKQTGDMALAAWTDTQNIYVLVVPGTTEDLQQLL